MTGAAVRDTCRLAVVVLTRDEELNLPECLTSLRGLAAPVVVVDSGSRDSTISIARDSAALVLSHRFTTHTAQWRWALANLPFAADWILGLDADQRLTPELRHELAELFLGTSDAANGFEGFYVKRRQVFRGRWIKHGGYYPKYLLKIFRQDRVIFDVGDLIDHHFHVRGRTGRLRGDLVESNHKENQIGFWSEKHIRYAELHAREELTRRCGEADWAISPRFFGTPDQRVVWLKQRWYQLPLYVRPVLYFVYRYFLRLGFLDGKQGFIFHFLQAFWYRLLVDVNLEEMLNTQARARHPPQ